jgi:hypothetical protein
MCPSLPIGIDERINRGFTQPVGQAIAIRHGLDAMCGQPIVVSLTCNADHFCPNTMVHLIWLPMRFGSSAKWNKRSLRWRSTTPQQERPSEASVQPKSAKAEPLR